MSTLPILTAEDKAVLMFLGSSKKYTMRSLAAIVKNTGMSAEMVRAVLNSPVHSPYVYRRVRGGSGAESECLMLGNGEGSAPALNEDGVFYEYSANAFAVARS